MTRLDDLLGEEFDTPEARLALELAREDQHLLAELVSLRKARGLSQLQVAEALGLSQATISAFERLGNDPHLSTVRRYCRAIGVMVRHHIDEDAETCTDSHYLSHVRGAGVDSVVTAAAVARNLSAWPKAAVKPPAARPLTSA